MPGEFDLQYFPQTLFDVKDIRAMRGATALSRMLTELPHLDTSGTALAHTADPTVVANTAQVTPFFRGIAQACVSADHICPPGTGIYNAYVYGAYAATMLTQEAVSYYAKEREEAFADDIQEYAEAKFYEHAHLLTEKEERVLLAASNKPGACQVAQMYTRNLQAGIYGLSRAATALEALAYAYDLPAAMVAHDMSEHCLPLEANPEAVLAAAMLNEPREDISGLTRLILRRTLHEQVDVRQAMRLTESQYRLGVRRALAYLTASLRRAANVDPAP